MSLLERFEGLAKVKFLGVPVEAFEASGREQLRIELAELCDGKQSAGANRIDGLVAVVGVDLFHDAAKVVFHRELR
jgi:hypothetical protein